MGAIDDIFMAMQRPRQHPDHVRGAEAADGIVDLGIDLEAHGNRFESAVGGGARLHFIFEPRLCEQVPAGIVGDPALDRRTTGIRVRSRSVELRPGPAARHRVPAVAANPGVVDQQNPGGALPGGFLELVGHGPVVGHGIALEQPRVLAGIARIADQHQHRLAANVDLGVVIPLVLRRHDAVADEHQLALR